VPNKNLLDDDEDAGTGALSTAIHDHSAEIGNLQNQLQSTNRSLENTKIERTNLEGTVESQKIQLSTLQTQLSSAKAAYETETRLLSTLRDRFTSQSSDIQKAREELIRAESDLSAIRVEKAEVEQNLLRDKEEIRELQRKMTETGSMIEVAKVEIEKAKKDAKQQKGLLAIAKKQLAARESERAKVEQELQESLAEVAETREELEAAEAELSRDQPTATTTNGFPLAPSPTLSGDSTSFASAKPLPVSPGSPSSISGPASAKSNNPFERLTAGSGSTSRSQSPFLPLATPSIPAPTDDTPAPNEGTTTDNPFTFDQAFGSEEAGPAPDVDGTSIGTEGTVQPSVPKIVGELNVVTNELSSPSSEPDLFSTPPMTGLDTLGSGARTSTVDPDAINLSTSGTPSAAPSTDRSGGAHTDINTPLKELDANDSDSSDENSEDETPLANLANRLPPPPNKVDLKVDAPKEAPVTNGHALPQSKVESPFPPVPTPIPPADAQGANAFPPAPAHPSATSPFAASSEAQKGTGMNDFDRAFGNLAGDARATTENNLSFDAAFEDQFDFNTSTSLPVADPSSSVSTTFPPAPANLSGTVKPSASGFENAFIPPQSIKAPTAPTSSIEGLPPLPQIPESKPFSFDDAFSSISHETKPFSFEDAFSTPAPALSPPPAASTATAPSSQSPPNAEAQSLSVEDASGSNMTRGDSGFATISSRTSSIPPATQSPVSAFASGSPVRNSTSPRDSLSFPTSQSRQDSPPPLRVKSPRRPTTSSSERSVDKNKDQGRHSKISVCRAHSILSEMEVDHLY
jgi:epidermal growth factor receptor substrate 15